MWGDYNSKGGSIHNRKYCSKKCQGEVRQGNQLSETWRKALSDGRKQSEKCKGHNLYNWKGGKETQAIRMKESFYKRKRLLKLPFDIDYLNRVLIAQNGLCFFCECSIENYKAIEHLTPVSRGGDNEEL